MKILNSYIVNYKGIMCLLYETDKGFYIIDACFVEQIDYSEAMNLIQL